MSSPAQNFWMRGTNLCSSFQTYGVQYRPSGALRSSKIFSCTFGLVKSGGGGVAVFTRSTTSFTISWTWCSSWMSRICSAKRRRSSTKRSCCVQRP